jgi:SAM-dependent MidA family methyltransferase
MVSLMSKLPEPNVEALQHSQRLREFIFTEIESNGGKIPFARFMELALYAPGLGYYTAGAQKFGEQGDFVTAPEISPLFAQCLARQCQQVLEQLEDGVILELGAGSGVMACDLLLALEQLACLPKQYLILEVSAELRERQRLYLAKKIPHLFNHIVWLDALPAEPIRGVIVANEVLDAMPVHLFCLTETGDTQEIYVVREQDNFVWEQEGGYTFEKNLMLPAWIKSISDCLTQGLILLIDYGFPSHEYYHPDRTSGTLMCHYRHHAHTDPLILVGLQDITAHVDFTAVAEAAVATNLQVAGFATQAAFLLNCGLLNLVVDRVSDNIKQRVLSNQQIQKLTSPAEMGELFKVIALTRDLDEIELLGFTLYDQRGRL